jgi:UDP-2,3-diacylglucosamine hydrolase
MAAATGRALFIADLHLTPARPEGGAALRRFLDERRGTFDALFVMGDLFDVWVGPAHLRLPDYRAELAALRRLAEAGVRVVIFKGNRDFLFGPPGTLTRALGAEVVSDYLVESFGPHRAYLCHGDLLCAGDHRYQAMRKVLRSRLVSAVAEAVPPAVSLRLAAGARQVSRAEIAAKARDGVRMDLCPKTLARVFAGRGDLARTGLGRFTGECDTLVCGHIHRPGIRDMDVSGRPRRVYVLGPWDAGPSWLEWDGREFTLHA